MEKELKFSKRILRRLPKFDLFWPEEKKINWFSLFRKLLMQKMPWELLIMGDLASFRKRGIKAVIDGDEQVLVILGKKSLR